MGLLRLDGQYGDAAVIAQMGDVGLPVVVRGRASHLLNHPQIQQVLDQPPASVVTHTNSGVVYDLFDGGWLWIDEVLPRCRVIVARRAAPPAPQAVTVGKRVGDMVYELFMTTTEDDAFLAQDIVNSITDVEPLRGSWPMRTWSRTRIDGAPTLHWGKNSGKSCVNGCGTSA